MLPQPDTRERDTAAGTPRGRTAAAGLLAAAAVLAGCAFPDPRPGDHPPEPAAVMNAAAREAFDLVNTRRRASGAPVLKVNRRCVAAAQDHAEGQAGRKTLSHGSLTESFAARMKRWGLLHRPVAENIGRGGSPAAAVEAWMRSPPHRASMLSPSYASAGVGFAGDTYVLCLSGDGGG